MKIFFLLALMSAPAFASPELKYSVGGAADLQGQYFPNALSSEVGRTFGILNAEATGTVKAGVFSAKLRPTGHLDPNNPTKAEQSWWDVPEGYAQVKGAPVEGVAGIFQLGWNTFTWGVTDGYNPIDVVSARRYSDPLNTEKLGAFSALGRLDLGFLLVEGIYIPWQRSSTLPGDHSRWLPRDIAAQVKQSGILFDTPRVPAYTFAEPRTFDDALRNNFGFRLSSHVLGIDGALYYFNGASSVPGTAYHFDGNVVRLDQNFYPLEIAANPLITLTPIYNNVKVEGASAVFNVWELVVRGELAITDAYHKGSSSFPEHATESVVELEHTFSGEKSSVTTIGLASFSDHRYGDSSTTSTPSLTDLFDQATGFGVRWQPAEAFHGEGFVVFDTKHGGEMFKLNLTYVLSDAWRAYAGGEILDGKSTQPVGTYGHNSRLIAGVKVSL